MIMVSDHVAYPQIHIIKAFQETYRVANGLLRPNPPEVEDIPEKNDLIASISKIDISCINWSTFVGSFNVDDDKPKWVSEITIDAVCFPLRTSSFYYCYYL